MFRLIIITSYLFVSISCMQEGSRVNMQQVAHGQEIYSRSCANCHGEDGKGLAKLIPPLLDADYLIAHQSELPCIIKNGIAGKITVNKYPYALKMPGTNKLSDVEIAAVCNFVLFRYGKVNYSISVNDVSNQLKQCK